MIMPSIVRAQWSLFVAGFSRAVAAASHVRSVPGLIHSIRHNLPVLYAEPPLTIGSNTRLVRDEHNGTAMQAIQLLKQLHNLHPRTRIDIAGRLIGEDQRRTVDERLCDSHALLLASRELVRSVLDAT